MFNHAEKMLTEETFLINNENETEKNLKSTNLWIIEKTNTKTTTEENFFQRKNFKGLEMPPEIILAIISWLTKEQALQLLVVSKQFQKIILDAKSYKEIEEDKIKYQESRPSCLSACFASCAGQCFTCTGVYSTVGIAYVLGGAAAGAVTGASTAALVGVFGMGAVSASLGVLVGGVTGATEGMIVAWGINSVLGLKNNLTLIGKAGTDGIVLAVTGGLLGSVWNLGMSLNSIFSALWGGALGIAPIACHFVTVTNNDPDVALLSRLSFFAKTHGDQEAKHSKNREDVLRNMKNTIQWV